MDDAQAGLGTLTLDGWELPVRIRRDWNGFRYQNSPHPLGEFVRGRRH